jgi:hypothetical protein
MRIPRRICPLQWVATAALLLLAGGFPSVADQIEVELRPLAGQDPASVRIWEICFESDVELHRLTVGVLLPTAYPSAETMAWTDCADDGSPCSGLSADIFGTTYTSVAPANSFAESVGDTLFLVLEGSLPTVDGSLESPSNWGVGHQCVARLALSAGVSTTNPPGLTSLVDTDTASIGWGSSCAEPIVVDGSRSACDTGGGSGLVSLSSSIVVASTIPEDFDEDLRRDEDDNCVYTSNVAQLDQGGLKTSASDDIGDACQCGEGEGTGQIMTTGADLTNMLDYLRGGAPAGFDVARCSVANPSTCTIHDAAVLANALVSPTTTLDNVCNADNP